MKIEKIGVAFCFDGYENHFETVFKDINLNNYTWYVTNSEIHCLVDGYPPTMCIFEPNIYSGQTFAEEMSKRQYHVIHARILATPTDKTIKPDEIVDYDAFLNSDCEIALLCADCYVDFYAKDEKIIDAVAEVCKQNFKCDVSFITKENDTRTGFFIG